MPHEFDRSHLMSTRWLEQSRDIVVICTSPKAGSGKNNAAVPAYLEACTEAGFEPIVSSEIEVVVDTVTEHLHSGRLRMVVAAGGDGTAGLLVNRLPAGVPIQVYPLGTENLLAKHFGLRRDPVHAAYISRCGRVEHIDLGEANGRSFMIMFSCGFDAEVVRRLHSTRTGHIHHLSYARPLLGTMCSYRYPRIKVVGDEQWSREGCWAFVFNIPSYALQLPLAPHAHPNDGLLDLCLFQRGRLFNGLRYLGGVIRGRHTAMKDVISHQSTTLLVEGDPSVPYQLDGDFVGFLPVELTVHRRRVSLVVPPEE